MSRRTQIAIVGHWHTGSSVIAKTFAACGMAVGNENTHWKQEYEAQCEQGELNWYGDQCWNGRSKTYNMLLPDRIRQILLSYIEEAERLDWNHYGIKITHFLQVPCLNFLLPIFHDLWKEVIYIISIRHPYEVMLSTANDWKWSVGRIMESYNSALVGYTLLKDYCLKNGNQIYLLRFPECFNNGSIERLIDHIGGLSAIIKSPYNASEVHWDVTNYLNDDGYKQFEKKYGDIIDGYESIQ